MAKRAWHHFTVRRLLVLTTLGAVVCGVLSSFRMPELVRAALIGFFMLEVFWLVFRWPSMKDDMYDLRRRRQQLIDNRRKLADEVASLKQQGRPAPTSEVDAESETP